MGGEKKLAECEGSEIARFVRSAMNAIMTRDVIISFSWSGTSRLNKRGIIEPKESYQALKGICCVIQGIAFFVILVYRVHV